MAGTSPRKDMPDQKQAHPKPIVQYVASLHSPRHKETDR